MKNYFRSLVTSFTVVMSCQPIAAQVTLGVSPYVQNFNIIGTGLPAGWTVRTGATASALGTPVSLTTTPTAWSNATGGFKNFAGAVGLTSTSVSSEQSAAANRALGLRQAASVGDPGAAFVLQLTNTIGCANFSMSFKLQSLDGSGTGRTTTWRVDYGIGTAPTSFISNVTQPAVLSSTLSSAGWGSTDIAVNFGTALDNSSLPIWIRIVTLTSTTGAGSRPTTAIDDVQLSYGEGDATAPLFTATYPLLANVTSTGVDVRANLNEPGKIFFVVLANGAAPPTAAQVKSGRDANDVLIGSGFFGQLQVIAASTDYSQTLSALFPDTEYDVYIVAEDKVPNLQAAPTLLPFRTLPTPDVSPPDFIVGYPRSEAITPTSVTMRMSLNEAGTVYFVALPQNTPAPTSTQVKQGRDSFDATLVDNLHGAISIVTSQTEYTTVISGLIPRTGYDIYFVSEDRFLNLLPVPVKITMMTGDLFIENFDVCNGTGSFTHFSFAGSQRWECTDLGRVSGGIRMNGFLGTARANEDWLISPALLLGQEAVLSYYSQFSFSGNTLQLKISLNYSGEGDPALAAWTNLNGAFPTTPVPSTSTAPGDWTKSTVSLAAYSGSKVYVAFVYTSSSATASRWTLDEVSVSNGTAMFMQPVPAFLSFLSSGTIKSYRIKGINLQGPMLITGCEHFEVSKDSTNFRSSISFSPEEASRAPKVFVRFSLPSFSTDFYTTTIAHTTPGIGRRDVTVRGADQSETLDVATYNLEFFGTNVKDVNGNEFGPAEDALQVSNVSRVLQTIGADIFAVEEIANDTAFHALVTSLPGYKQLVANRWSHSQEPPNPNFPPQKIGFIYDSTMVVVENSRLMFANLYDSIVAGTATLPAYPGGSGNNFWSSGRLPFLVTLNITLNGISKRVVMIALHAKSGATQSDYNRRKYDTQVLYDSLTAHYRTDPVILLGDFNDDVDVSITSGAITPYQPFVEDSNNFSVLTSRLSQRDGSTFPSSNGFLDHVLLSTAMADYYIENSVRIEDPSEYISNYGATTSDHLPVFTRFLISKKDQAIAFSPLAPRKFGEGPFTLVATSSSGLPVRFTSSDSSIVSIQGYAVTILKAGMVDITAHQEGSKSYNPANEVVQSLQVTKADQAIVFQDLPIRTFGDTPFIIKGKASSGLPVHYSSAVVDVAAVSDSIVSITGAGTTTITATQEGNADYNPASVARGFLVRKADQSILFTVVPDKTVGDDPFMLVATTSSGLPVRYERTSDKVSLTENEVKVRAAGRAVIKANQPGNGNYNAAPSFDRSFCIRPAKPVILISGSNPGSPILVSSSPEGNQWYRNDVILTGAINGSITVTGSGVYKVQTKVDDCLSAFSADMPFILTESGNAAPQQLAVHPNPSTRYIEILGLQEEVTSIRVMDMTGRITAVALEKHGDHYQGPVEELEAGMYIVQCTVGSTVHQLKFVKN